MMSLINYLNIKIMNLPTIIEHFVKNNTTILYKEDGKNFNHLYLGNHKLLSIKDEDINSMSDFIIKNDSKKIFLVIKTDDANGISDCDYAVANIIDKKIYLVELKSNYHHDTVKKAYEQILETHNKLKDIFTGYSFLFRIVFSDKYLNAVHNETKKFIFNKNKDFNFKILESNKNKSLKNIETI